MKKLFFAVMMLAFIVSGSAISATQNGLKPQVEKPRRLGKTGPHHRILNKVVVRTNEVGKVSMHTNQIVELASGMHVMRGNKWEVASPEIGVLPDGSAESTKAAHKVHFAANLNSPEPVRLETPDGKVLRSRVVGLAYYDFHLRKSVLFAEVKDSVGTLFGSNQVVYADAFTDVKADVRYTNLRSGLEQDIILRECPPLPEEFGMNPKTTWLEVWTEFIDPPAPSLKQETRRNWINSKVDKIIDFGQMKIVEGNAFGIGEAGKKDDGVQVYKHWEKFNNRTFLIEEVSFSLILPEIRGLHKRHAAVRPKGKSIVGVVSDERTLPERKLADKATPTQKMRVASASPLKSPALVIDYMMIDSDEVDFTFQSDTTYLVAGPMYLSGKTTIEGGTVVKYCMDAGLILLGDVTCKTGPYRPAVFTTEEDNTVGESVSTGSNPVRWADPALQLGNGGTLSYVYVRYAKRGVVSTAPYTVLHSQFVHCDTAVQTRYTSSWLRNILMHDVTKGIGGRFFRTYIEHLTFDSGTFVDEWLYDDDPSCVGWNSAIYLKNSIITGVAPSEIVQLVYGDDVYFGTAQGVYNPVGAGGFYLAESPDPSVDFRNKGTTAIDPELAGDLKKKTTHAPVVVNQLSTSLSARAGLRDTDTPDLGYHYDPLDYVIAPQTVTGSLQINNPVAIGLYNAITIAGGANITSSGAVSSPNRIVWYNTVQEEPESTWASSSPLNFFNGACPSGASASVTFNSTELTRLTGSHGAQASCFFDVDAGSFTFQNCQFLNGYLRIGNSQCLRATTASFQNCLFERVPLFLETDQADGTLTVSAYNNLFWNGTNTLSGEVSATFKDNLFDWTVLSASASTVLQADYNAYVSGANRWESPGTSDVLLPDSPPYQHTPSGWYYYPSTWYDLAERGSRSADDAGLDQFTTTYDQTADSGTVEIGYHYPLLSSPVLPAILVGPRSQSKPNGSPAVFTVQAQGTDPLSYQWFRNGSEIYGATSSELTFSTVSRYDQGYYSVRVSNAAGGTMSAAAMLTVFVPFNIMYWPSERSVHEGTPVTFEVSVDGVSPFARPEVSSGTLRLHLDADSLYSLGPVAYWYDHSGNGNGATQSDSTRRPSLVTVNGKKAVRFDGNPTAGKYMHGTGDLAIPDAYTAFTVYSRGTQQRSSSLIFSVGGLGDGGDWRAQFLQNTASGSEMLWSGCYPEILSGIMIPENEFRIRTDRLNRGKTLIEMFNHNGSYSEPYSESLNPNDLIDPEPGYYMGGNPTGDWYLAGDISEVLCYRGALSDTDRTEVEEYLKQKWLEPTPTYHFQWKRNGTIIYGETGSALTITDPTEANEGWYTVEVRMDDPNLGFVVGPDVFLNVIGPTNSAPLVQNDEEVVLEDNTSTIFIYPCDGTSGLIGNDAKGPAHENSQTLTLTAVQGNGPDVYSATAHGTVFWDSTLNLIFYTPHPDYNGQDSFTYTVTDDGSSFGHPDPKSAQATVTITVQSPDQPDSNDDTPELMLHRGRQLSTPAAGPSCNKIVSDGTTGYILGSGVVQAYDIYSDEPVHMAIEEPQDVVDLALRNSKLFLVNDQHLYIVDVSKVTDPYVLSSQVSVTGTGCVALSQNGNTIILADESGLRVIDATTPTAPVIRSTVSVGTPLAVACSPDAQYAYVLTAGVQPELKIYDISVPTSPVLKSSLGLDLFGAARALALNNDRNLLYVMSSCCLQSVNVSNPENPTLSNKQHYSTALGDQLVVSPDGNRLYVASQGLGVRVIDSTDFSRSTLLVPTFDPAVHDIHDVIDGIALSPDGTKAYMAGLHGITVFQIESEIGMDANQPGQIKFTVQDPDTLPQNITLFVYSSDAPSVIPKSNVTFSRNNNTWTATVNPINPGDVELDIYASDSKQVDIGRVAIKVYAAPAILTQPQSVNAKAGATVTFSVVATGTPELKYQWKRNGSVIDFATDASYSMGCVLNADEGIYTVDVTAKVRTQTGSQDQTITSAGATLLVADPYIERQPQGQAVEPGEWVYMDVIAHGTALTYQWQKLVDSVFTDVDGQTQCSLSFNSFVPAEHAGIYRVKIMGPETIYSLPVSLTVIDPEPFITQQPQSLVRCMNETACFSVEATGVNITYQWYKVGTGLLSGQTSKELQITISQESDYGDYYVVVGKTGSSAEVTSAIASLRQPPKFHDGTIALSTGAGLISWYYPNGALKYIEGSSEIYDISYDMLFNSDSRIISAHYYLSMLTELDSCAGMMPFIQGTKDHPLFAPRAVAMDAAGNVFVADGGRSTAYGIRRYSADGTVSKEYLPGQTVLAMDLDADQQSLYYIPYVPPASPTIPYEHSRKIFKLTLDANGDQVGNPVLFSELTCAQDAGWDDFPMSMRVLPGTPTRIAVADILDVKINTATESIPLECVQVDTGDHWNFSLSVDSPTSIWVSQRGYINNPGRVVHVELEQDANGNPTGGHVVSQFTTGSLSQGGIALLGELRMGRLITEQPESQFACAGDSSVTFSVAISPKYTGTVSYQWYKDDTELSDVPGKISGAATAQLTVQNIATGDQGRYTVLLSGTGVDVRSAPAVLIVGAPVINRQPVSQTVAIGQAADLRVTAEGKNLSYQWQNSSGNIAGATQSSYAPVANVAGTETYTVVVSACGDNVTSAPAIVTTRQFENPETFSQMAHWWPAEGNGDDIVGHAHAVVYPSVWYEPGKVNRCFSFSGIDHGVDCGLNGNFGRGDFSVEFWMATKSIGDQELISKGDILPEPEDSTIPFWEVRLTDNRAQPPQQLLSQIEFRMSEAFGRNKVVVTAATAANVNLRDGNFHHIAVVRDSLDVTVYIDGVATTVHADAVANLATCLGEFERSLWLGRGDSYQGVQNFIGKLDEISVYRKALSAQDVQTAYGEGPAGKAARLPNVTCTIDEPWPEMGGPGFLWLQVPGHPNAEIHYTMDGSEPTASSPIFTTSIIIPKEPAGEWSFVFVPTYIRAIAIEPGWFDSEPFSIILSIPGPNISTQPKSQKVVPDENPSATPVTFMVVADGHPPFAYQWWFNDAPIEGATSSALNRLPIAANEGTYYVTVSDPFGTAESDHVTLQLGAIPTVDIDDLIAWWPGEGDAEDMVFKYNNQRNVGSYEKTRFVPGRVGQAFCFTDYSGRAADGSVIVPHAAALEPAGAFSIEAWIKIVDSAIDDRAILRKGEGTVGYEIGYSVEAGSVGRLHARIGSASCTASTTFVLGQWHHLLMTCSSGTLKLYLDGAQCATASGATMVSSEASFIIGGDNGAGDLIDEVMLYNRALSATEAQSHAASPNGVLSTLELDPLADGTIAANQTVWLDVAGRGRGPLAYQWFRDGIAVVGNTWSSMNATSAGTYQVIVWDGLGTKAVEDSVLTHSGAPYIKDPPEDSNNQHVANRVVGQDEPITLAVSAIGSAPLSYSWSHNGTVIGSANASAYTINSAQTGNAGTYTVVVGYQGGGGGTSSAEFHVTVNGPLTITANPQDQTVNAGESVSFSVQATGGTTPLNYKWYYRVGSDSTFSRGQDRVILIQDGTSPELVVNRATPAHAGKIWAVVSTATGTKRTSEEATLAVTAIATPAPDGMVAWWKGEDATGTGAVITDSIGENHGALDDSVESISGVVGNALHLDGIESQAFIPDSASLKQTGSFTIEGWIQALSSSDVGYVVNPGILLARGNGTSHPYWLYVDPTFWGGYIEFGIEGKQGEETVGQSVFSFLDWFPAGQWVHIAAVFDNEADTMKLYLNGRIRRYGLRCEGEAPINFDPVGDLTGSELTIGNDASGNYPFCGNLDELSIYSRALTDNEVENIYFASTEGKVPGTAPVITTQPVGKSVLPGEAFELSVVVSGYKPIEYQWYKDSVALNNATSSVYSISSAQTSDAGTYTVEVKNIYSGASALSSQPAVVIVQDPCITAQPASQTAGPGMIAMFSVRATGTHATAETPLNYQWYYGNTLIPGATTSSYALTDVQTSDAGTYWVKVTDSESQWVDSEGAVLTIQDPFISKRPAHQFVQAGQTATFAVEVAGTGPFTYQWSFEGTTVSTESSCQILNAQQANAGEYEVVVSDGTTQVSASARLVVIEHPTANSDILTVSEDSTDNVLDVLANDSSDAGELSIETVTSAAHGSVQKSGDSKTLIYTPEAGFYGIDSFTYTVADGSATSSAISVKVFVNQTGNQPPVAAEKNITLRSSQATVTIDILPESSDPDQDVLSIESVAAPSKGTATISGNTQIIYQRTANKYGTDKFTYILTDGKGGHAVGTIYVHQADIDGDGMPDRWELDQNPPLALGVDDSESDPDADGVPNLGEYVLCTNPALPESVLHLPAFSTADGYVLYPLDIPSEADSETIFVVRANENDVLDAFVTKRGDGKWWLQVNTSTVVNGVYRIQLGVRYGNSKRVTEAFGQSSTILIRNAVTFEPIASEVSDVIHVEASLNVPVSSCNIQIRSFQGDTLDAKTVTPENGQIATTFDPSTFSGPGAEGPFLGKIQCAGLPSSEMVTFWGRSAFHGDEDVVVAVGNREPYGNNLENMIGNALFSAEGGGASDLVAAYCGHFFPEPGDGNKGNDPGQRIAWCWRQYDLDAGYKTKLLNSLKRDSASTFYWCGHGGPNCIIAQLNCERQDYHTLTAKEIADALGNDQQVSIDKERGIVTRQHRGCYKLVVLDGCSTYQETLARAFGMRPEIKYKSAQEYRERSLSPRSFVGWTKDTGQVYQPGKVEFVTGQYQIAIQALFRDWARGVKIKKCMEKYNEYIHDADPILGETGFANFKYWDIYGPEDLTIND